MEEKSIELKKIMDDIEAGLIDDPLEDYRYLQQEANKYNDHALYEDIMNALADILFVKIPSDLHNGIMKNSSVKAEDFAAFDFI